MTESKTEIELTCEGCDHAKPIPEALGQALQCRGAPPQVLLVQATMQAVYPIVSPRNPACGVYKPKLVS